MRIRAIIFDDDDIVRDRVSRILKERGYEVFDFAEAEHCPLRLRTDCPCPLEYACADIIISDISMPGITGLEFIKNQLKHGCKVQHWAVMTFNWTDEQLKCARQLGCHTLEKPFEEEPFVDWLVECERSIDPQRMLSDWFLLDNKTNNNKDLQ